MIWKRSSASRPLQKYRCIEGVNSDVNFPMRRELQGFADIYSRTSDKLSAVIIQKASHDATMKRVN
jgi:hypothetical protein